MQSYIISLFDYVIKTVSLLECSALAVFCLASLTLRLAFCSHHFLFRASNDLRSSLVLCLACKCLLCFLVVSLCHAECSRNNTHSSPQPSAVMLCQPVLGSFRPVTPGLVTPGTPLCTSHSAPFALPALLLKTSTARIFIYRFKHWLAARSQYFRTKYFPFAQHMYEHTVLPSTFII